MPRTQKTSKSQKLTNIIGTFGYMSAGTQWLWAVATLALPYMIREGDDNIFLPTQPVEQAPTTVSSSFMLPDFVSITIIVITVSLLIAFTLYVVLYKLPKTIGQTGHQFTKQTVKVALPHITHHKKLSKAREKRLNERITWLVKAVLIAVPLVASLITPPSDLELSHANVIVISVFLAVMSAVLFICQFTLSKLFRLDAESIW